MDQFEQKVRQYQECVTAFMAEAQAWCDTHGLVTDEITVELLEEGLPKYSATGLHILTAERKRLAELLPTGSAIIGALGRIDLRGALARHPFLLQTGTGPSISISSTTPDGKTTSDTPLPLISGIRDDGWYWYEAFVRRPKRVDESLFLDLLTDVSDYEFQ